MNNHRNGRAKMQRYHVYFEGRVQGVGFRATVRSIARGHAVVGQVRNLPDGRVELWVEGQPEALHAFLEAILEQFAGYIKRHTLDKQPATGEFGAIGAGPGRVEIVF